MPYYLVQHITPLSDEQQDKLAEAITHLHSELFSTPTLFVNVEFVDVSQAKTYVAGKRQKGNKIQAYVRAGPGRTREHYAKICHTLDSEWKQIVGSKGDQGTTAIFIHGTIIAGFEQGFDLPEAGQDGAWMKTHYHEFQKLADGGNPEFQQMVHEIKTRPCFNGIANGVNGHS